MVDCYCTISAGGTYFDYRKHPTTTILYGAREGDIDIIWLWRPRLWCGGGGGGADGGGHWWRNTYARKQLLYGGGTEKVPTKIQRRQSLWRHCRVADGCGGGGEAVSHSISLTPSRSLLTRTHKHSPTNY